VGGSFPFAYFRDILSLDGEEEKVTLAVPSDERAPVDEQPFLESLPDIDRCIIL
jgi:hypothetical protein